jgi:ketosteroid isomerase-like protein
MNRDAETRAFEDWLRRYGYAWESRDPEAAAALFTDDAKYHWTPFGDPKLGPAGIAAAWREATSRQIEVRFNCEVLAVEGATGIAHWHTRLTRPASGKRVEIDGILLAELEPSGKCRLFREWWHSNEKMDD